MEANELRIGNLVVAATAWKDNERLHPVLFSDEPYIIDSINHLDCDLCDFPNEKNSYNVNLGDLNPIPLTEEWLRSFGFVNGTTEKLKEVTHASIQYSAIEKMYHLYLGHHSLSVYLKYVHQLQNLYFALTGEELTLKQ